MTNGSFDNAIKILQKAGDQRVWSLITTIFGDMASGPADVISGRHLTGIAEKLQIKPDAMRVALHRLRKDGWINSTRSGRISHYALTDFGRSETRRARLRIYGPTIKMPENWHLQFAPAMPKPDQTLLQKKMAARGYLCLSNQVYMRRGVAENIEPCFAINTIPAQIPDWIKDLIFQPELVRITNEFEKTLIEIKRMLHPSQKFSSDEIIALRALIVHYWRKIVLRCPVVPEPFFPKNWRITECRVLVDVLLSQLGQPSFDQL